MKIKYDLHIHTALSPCGSDDMTPNNIVNMAILSDLDAIAITDHNSCKNVEAVMKVSKNKPLIVIPGMEIETKEEIHVVCLFLNLDSVYNMQNIIYNSLPKLSNRADIFGKQLILDENDEIIGEENRLLLTATSLSIQEINNITNSLGGVMIPAHIDRPSYSIISNLGILPDDIEFCSLEISKYVSLEKYVNKYTNYNIIQSSDSHELGFIGECEATLTVEDRSIEGIINVLKKVIKS